MPSSETKTYLAACAQIHVESGDVPANLKRATAAVRAAAERGAELIVLPEMWTTSFVVDPSKPLAQAALEAEEAMTSLSGELGVMVIGGGLEEQDGQYFNRCSLADRGEVLSTYRKIHLFSPNAEPQHMAPGRTAAIVDSRLGRIGLAICYDIRFPELIRYYFHMGVQVLAVPSQWPEARSDHWRTLTRARAVENQMFVIGCNRVGTEESMRNGETLVFPGDSRIVDPMGGVIGMGQGESEPLMAEIELRRCRAMQRILPIHKDRQTQVYRDLWEPIWNNPEQPSVPEVPTIETSASAGDSTKTDSDPA